MALAVAALLCWPLLFVPFPPYQDLYGHSATIWILTHRASYPEFEATTPFKTNSLYTTLGARLFPFIGVATLAKCFVVFTVLLTAYALVAFVSAFRGRRGLLAALPFLPPLAHHWFISMGMVNFAVATGCVLLCIAWAREQHQALKPRLTLGATILCTVAWFAHPLPALIGLAVVIGLTLWGELRSPGWLIASSPIAAYAVASVGAVLFHASHAGEATRTSIGTMIDATLFYNPPSWLLYDAWAQCLVGFSRRSLASVFLGLVLIVASARQRKRIPGVNIVLALLITAYFLAPYRGFGLSAFNPRLLPFIWTLFLLSAPLALGAWLRVLLYGASVLYVLGMNADVFLLSKEEHRIASGLSVIPQGAHLMPVFFQPRDHSDNTRNFDSISGMFVWERGTNAFDVWSHSRSYPIFRQKPAAIDRERVSSLVMKAKFDTFQMSDCAAYGLSLSACRADYDRQWAHLWNDAARDYEYVLTWSAPETAIAPALAFYEPIMRDRELVFYRRKVSTVTAR